MSYLTISQMSQSGSLFQRCSACAAQEIDISLNPTQWAADNMLRLAAQPGWSEAWESAVASGIPDPGADPAVIQDGQILAAVQSTYQPPA